jgi:two-component system sensor histidine kinase ChiS
LRRFGSINAGKVYFALFFTLTLAFTIILGILYYLPYEIEEEEPALFRFGPDNQAGIGRLAGHAHFFPRQLLSPKDFTDGLPEGSTLVKMPDYWQNYEIDGKPFDNYSYGTFYFRIKIEQPGNYCLSTRTLHNAYKLWLNDSLVATKGKPGTDRQSTCPGLENHQPIFRADSGVATIILQLSNFRNYGGIVNSLILGREEQVSEYNRVLIAMDFLLLGILIVMGIYHLGLFVLYPSEKPSLFFSIVAFLIALRQLALSEKVFYDLFSWANWAIVFKTEHILLILSSPLLIMYFNSFYKAYTRQWLTRAIYLLAFSFSILFIFTPAHFIPAIYRQYQWVFVVASLYIINIIIRAHANKAEYSWYYLLGGTFTILFALTGFLRFNVYSDIPFSLHLGILLLLITQSYTLTERIVKGFTDSRKLARVLGGYNIRLRESVEERTKKLATQNKKLEELSNFKESMTGMIVHDLRNPLNFITNLSENETIRHIARQMTDQVNDIIDIQKNEEAKIQVKASPCDIREIVDMSLKQVVFLCREKELVIEKSVNCTIPVLADPELLRRVMVNLLTNAIKYAPRGTRIHISCHEQDDRPIQVRVADQGKGIPDEWKQRIFSKYQQADKQDTSISPSAGLGLAFCKLAIEAHGQRIWVEDAESGGAAFLFTLEKDQSRKPGRLSNTEKIKLRPEDKKRLAPLVNKLRELEAYQASAIIRILESEARDSTPVMYWIDRVKSCIYSGDEDMYRKLLTLAE